MMNQGTPYNHPDSFDPFGTRPGSNFPKRPVRPVPLCEHVPTKHYYPTYDVLATAEKAYFVYWRQEYEAGNPLTASTTYLILYAFELAFECPTAEQLGRAWSALALHYNDDGLLYSYLTRWICDLRLQQGLALTAIQMEKLPPLTEFSLSIKQKLPLAMALVCKLYSKGSASLSADPNSLAIDTAQLFESAAEAETYPRFQQLFSGMGEASYGLSRFGLLAVSIPIIEITGSLQFMIDTIVETAALLCGSVLRPSHRRFVLMPPDLEVVRELPGIEHVRAEIARRALSSIPNIDSLDGLRELARSKMANSMQLLLLVILWLSDRKPYIEGQINFSQDLRKMYAAFSTELDRRAALSQIRTGFWSLGTGQRALWAISPPAVTPSDISKATSARFLRPVQQLLIGSAAREALVDALIDGLCNPIDRKPTSECTRDSVLAAARLVGLIPGGPSDR